MYYKKIISLENYLNISIITIIIIYFSVIIMIIYILPICFYFIIIVNKFPRYHSIFFIIFFNWFNVLFDF